MCDILSFLFPCFCVGCGSLGSYFCSNCKAVLKKNRGESCLYCGKRTALGLTHVRCKKRKGVDGWRSIYRYDAPFKKVLIGAKYKKARLVLESLLKQDDIGTYKTIWRWKKLFDPTIVPVPLNGRRLDERGFNQSSIIGQHLSSRTGIPHKELLIRSKNTPHLAQMEDKYERRRAVRRAFCYVGKEIPQSVILVDDVITTGATIGECARTLKDAGVKNVLAFSLAK